MDLLNSKQWVSTKITPRQMHLFHCEPWSSACNCTEKNSAAAGRREAACEIKLKMVTRKGINDANTIRQWRRRRRQVSHSANHRCAHWCRRWTWGRSLTFGLRWRYGGKLLWLVVEGRCGDFEVEGGGHHVWLVTAGVLHVAVSIGGEQMETT